MPRHTTKKTSASAKTAIIKKSRSEGQLKRQRLIHEKSIQEHPEPGPSDLHHYQKNYSIDEESNNPVIHRNTKLHQIARQDLSLGFSTAHRLKPFSITCPHCSAIHWIEERTVNSTMKNPQFSMCCAGGKVTLPCPEPPPAFLKNYLLDETPSK
jgi:hypothetical protein